MSLLEPRGSSHVEILGTNPVTNIACLLHHETGPFKKKAQLVGYRNLHWI